MAFLPYHSFSISLVYNLGQNFDQRIATMSTLAIDIAFYRQFLTIK